MYETVETFREGASAITYLKRLGFYLTPSLVFWRRGADKVFILGRGGRYEVLRCL